ncbi:MAG: L,D-transpeptidase family protein [Pseudomonadota bacterium]
MACKARSGTRATIPLLHWLALLAFVSSSAVASDLPPYVLQWPTSSTDLLVAETDAAVLHHYRRMDDGSVRRDEIYLSVGLNGVGKQREWDQKTPLGVYIVTSELDTSRLHEKYGVNAFPLDYPNARDRQLGRTGSGIWLHGVLPGGERRPRRDTDGCLAIPNDELSALSKRIVPGDTPVVIARQLNTTPASVEASRRALLNGIEDWRQASEQGDLRRLRTLYREDFSYDGLDRDTWLASAIDLPDTTLAVSDVLLVADPVEEGLYLSRFTLTKKGPQSRALIKRLYWQRDGSTYRIVAEDAF